MLFFYFFSSRSAVSRLPKPPKAWVRFVPGAGPSALALLPLSPLRSLRVRAPRVCLGAALLGVERPGLAVGGKFSPADTWALCTHKTRVRSARTLLLSGWAACGVYRRHLGRFYTSSMQRPHLHLNVPANFYGLQLHFTILRYSFLQRVCSDKRGFLSGDITGIC